MINFKLPSCDHISESVSASAATQAEPELAGLSAAAARSRCHRGTGSLSAKFNLKFRVTVPAGVHWHGNPRQSTRSESRCLMKMMHDSEVPVQNEIFTFELEIDRDSNVTVPVSRFQGFKLES